jgi:DNA invertase Pin-like site-specific DNA recombinase
LSIHTPAGLSGVSWLCSLRDLIVMLDDLKNRSVKFRSLTEAIDTDTPTGRAMWQMIGVLGKALDARIPDRSCRSANSKTDLIRNLCCGTLNDTYTLC